jgi:hypothetical protein
MRILFSMAFASWLRCLLSSGNEKARKELPGVAVGRRDEKPSSEPVDPAVPRPARSPVEP